MIGIRKYSEDYSTNEYIKCTCSEKANRVMFTFLHSLLECPEKIVDDYELMTDSEQDKLMKMLRKKILKYNK
jgi:hypothetical protein